MKMDRSVERVALIAGEGKLPEEIFSALEKRGIPTRVYSLRNDNSFFDLPEGCFFQVEKIDIEKIITDMKIYNIKELIMGGLVPKSLIFRSDGLGDSTRAVLGDLQEMDDHTLLAGIVSIFEKAGIRVRKYVDLIPEVLTKEGPLTTKGPDEEQWKDIEYGKKILKVLLPLSFGQSVVIKGRSVVAVEAMEGTDRMIYRSKDLSQGGVVVKMMRPDQDERYDIPSVGPDTLDNMKKAGLDCLAIEAGRTIILDRELFLERANAWDIVVTGVRPCPSS